MKSKKVLIGIASLIVVVAGIVLGMTIWKEKGNGQPGAGGSTSAIPTNIMKENSLTANSYEEVYSQFVLAEIKDYFGGSSRGEEVLEESKVASSEMNGSVDSSSKSDSIQQSGDSFGKTNVQVEGVDEGDIVKNDGKYLYCQNGNAVSIINAQDKEMRVESVISNQKDLKEMYVLGNKMLLLSQSGQQDYFPDYAFLNEGVPKELVADGYNDEYKHEEPKVTIKVYDITSRKKPQLVSTKTIDGWFQTSRISDGYLYVIANKDMYGVDYEEDDPSTYVPKVDEKTMNYKDVIIPDADVCFGYLIVTSLSVDQPEHFADQKAIFSNGYNYYVSTSNIFIADTLYREPKTLITKINYEDGKLAVGKQGKVEGYIKDNFSLDEYEDHLRIVTTVQDYEDKETTTYNNLYVLDNTLKEVGKIERLAKNEVIYSSRFMGDVGYFVTFRQVDPLFSVDLSNPRKPKIIGKLKIPGFSSYLHFYGKNLLLGIGQEADPKTGRTMGLKLSMFDISDPGDVKEMHKMYLGENTYSESEYDHKAIMVNAEQNIIGFSYEEGIENIGEYYGVYHYDDTLGFVEEYTLKQDRENYAQLRGTYVGDKVYLLSLARYNYDIYKENSYVKAFDRKNYKLLDQIDLD